ncbi:hypothetical protein WH47_01675, partial [Habropoda laboriosa]
NLVKIDGILRKEEYLKILEEHAVPVMEDSSVSKAIHRAGRVSVYATFLGTINGPKTTIECDAVGI